jgi:hypothetical protein
VQTHFSQEDWIDFARGVQCTRGPELQAHLDRCAECQKTAALWKSVAVKTSQESRFQPPRDAVQNAKAAFVLRGLHVRGSWPLRFAQIILDSAFAPAVAGVRSGDSQSRHLVLGAETMRIELIMEPIAGIHTHSVAITGQIIDDSQAAGALSGSRVLLAQNTDIVEMATASKNGEFFLNGRSDLPGWLVVDIEGKNPVAARLPLALQY